jgi:hypothetical protein
LPLGGHSAILLHVRGSIVTVAAAVALDLASPATAQRPARLATLEVPVLAARLRADARAAALYRQGLLDAVALLDRRPDLVPADKLERPRALAQAERQAILATWRSSLDYLLALDSLVRFHNDFHRLRGESRGASLVILEAAWVAQYRGVLELTTRFERNPGLDTILNEAVAEQDLPPATYARAKNHFLDLARLDELTALGVLRRTLKPAATPELQSGIQQDRVRLLALGIKPAPALAVHNAWRMVRRAGFSAWFPVQAGVSEWMGDTKVKRKGVSLVTREQIAGLAPALEPGDVLLERREWYLSNIGLPGFWPHAALYVGTPAERERYFDDPAVRDWSKERGGDGSLDSLLRARHPAALTLSLAPFEGEAPRVLEAMSEGVVFTSLQHSAAADSLAVLRPRLAKLEKADAILIAFGYAGRPYDFNFDFLTDNQLVCTELVYRAYEPAGSRRGLHLPLVPILGRMSLPANEIVRRFDLELGTPEQQFDLVAFLDGEEREGLAVPAGVDSFRRSWTRPKWHVVKR